MYADTFQRQTWYIQTDTDSDAVLQCRSDRQTAQLQTDRQTEQTLTLTDQTDRHFDRDMLQT